MRRELLAIVLRRARLASPVITLRIAVSFLANSNATLLASIEKLLEAIFPKPIVSVTEFAAIIIIIV